MNDLILYITIAFLLITGVGVALLGSIKLSLARKLLIDEARIGGLVSAFGLTIIPMILVSGLLTDYFGERVVLFIGSVLMIVGLGLLGSSRGYLGALVAVLFLGSAWSAMVNAVNVAVPVAFGGNMAYATNLANVFFGLGAFFTPMGLAYLLRRKPMSTVLYGLGLLVSIPAILAFFTIFHQVLPLETVTIPTEALDEAGLLDLLADPVLWMCGLGMFFYAPLEAAMGAWSTTYLANRGLSEQKGLHWLSFFWLSFMLSRLITAYTLPAGAEAGLVLVLALFAILLMSSVVFSKSGRGAVFTVVGAGFFFGPIFPTLLALLLGYFPPAVHGRAVGLFFAIGAVGWTIIPALIGRRAKRSTLQSGFLYAIASAIGLTIIAIALIGSFGFYSAR